MTEMVERVARAMRETPGWMPPGLSESEWKMLARAAIAAMREPTEAMGRDGGKEVRHFDSRFDTGSEAAADVWRAMVDEALS